MGAPPVPGIVQTMKHAKLSPVFKPKWKELESSFIKSHLPCQIININDNSLKCLKLLESLKLNAKQVLFTHFEQFQTMIKL